MTVDEIYGQMMEAFAQETGVELRESCDLAVRFYTVAAQIEGLYHQLEWVKGQCFPQTATGTALDYHAQLRGLSRKEAARATGVLRFLSAEGQTSDRVITAGTVAMTASLVRFETVEDCTLLAGDSYIDVEAVAVEAGEGGNVAPLAIVSMASAPVGIVQCSNLAAFSGGGDGESDDSLRTRVLATYRRLANGVNVAYYEQEALAYDGVEAVVVNPCARGLGTVDIVVTSEDGLPSDDLVQALNDYFEVRREIVVSTLVRAPETYAVAVNIKVSPSAGYTQSEAATAVRAVLAEWFGGAGLGRDVLLAQLGSLIFSCAEVANCKIVAPSADVAVSADVLPVLSGVSVGVLA